MELLQGKKIQGLEKLKFQTKENGPEFELKNVLITTLLSSSIFKCPKLKEHMEKMKAKSAQM